MRVVFVVGFYNPILATLQREFPAQLADQSIMWVGPWGQHGDGDLRNFNSLFFDRLAVGATHVLVLVVVKRGRERFAADLRDITQRGKDQNRDLILDIREFRDAIRTGPALIHEIKSFLTLPQEVPEVISHPDSLHDLAGWCDRELKGKVFMHTRAIAAARKSNFEDVQLVYKSLLLLGNEYREMRLNGGAENRERCQFKANELGVEISKTISECHAGEQGEEYFVVYPSAPTRRLLELHLKKGSIKNERYCLRVYFFWDAERGVVVVGSLPAHLRTRET